MPFDPSYTPPPVPPPTCPPSPSTCRQACESCNGGVGAGGGGGGNTCTSGNCECEEPGGEEEGSCGPDCPLECGCSAGTSSQPIRYSSGEIDLTVSELSANGFGWRWGHTRTYSNQLSSSYDFGNGYNWIVKQWAYLTDQGSGVVTFVISPSNTIWFDPVGGAYVARFGALQSLTHNAGTGTFTVSSPDGTRWEFHDFTQTSFPPGILKRFTTVGNQSIDVTSYTADDRIGQVERSAVVNGVTISEAFVYDYYSGTQSGRLANVTLRRRSGSAPWSDVRRVRYDYYEAADSCGSLGDLRTATVETPRGTDWAPVNTRYYRYYRTGDAFGFAHGLKFVFSSAAFHRLKRDVGDPFTATDEQAAAFADFYYEYDGEQRVVLERVAAGTRQFTFSYFTNSTNPETPNSWKQRTTETQPDGTENVVYGNFLGQVMLKLFRKGGSQWLTYRKYGEITSDATKFRLIERADPSAVVSFNEAQPDLGVSLKNNAGLIHLINYHDGSSGSPVGFPAGNSIKEGASGTPIKQNEWQWTSTAVGGLTVYNLSTSTTYKNAAGGGTEGLVTTYSYTYRTGTNQVEQKTTTLPVVPVEQNGSGASPVQRARYDSYANLIWEQGPKGFIDNFAYDIVLGTTIQMIDDVDSSYLAYPAGWSRPSDLPAPPLHLITDYTYDALGRRTQTLGPVHEIDGVATRRASWSVFLDTEHEVRRANGFATGIGPNYVYTLVNPVQISQRNSTERVLDQISAARPDTNGRLCGGDSFPQSSWTAWTQSILDDRDDLIASRAYHTIPAVGTGEPRANYDETAYAYEIMGRRSYTRSPGGTITRVTYDPRGLLLKTYIGTNDTGATDNDPLGGGAAGNNLVLVTENEYDGGAAGGDGNLTKLTQFVDGVSGTSRVTNFTYDFRDRQITIDGEIDLYVVNTYDNLDRVIKVQRYNTSTSGNLLAQSETLFDDRGNVYQTKQYAVNPSTGVVGNALVDNFWYDAAGNRIKELPAGSERFTKRNYDGVKRVTAQYVGYFTGSPPEPYVDAGRVTSSNKLFEQTLMTFDGGSNLIQVTSYQRFHDATGNGLLNLPDAAQPRARVAYQANYYDGLGRSIAIANYGTNNNVTFTRPAEIPERSDDVLVTSTFYNDAGSAFQAIDPAGMATRTEFDARGRQTAVIQNDTGGCPGNDANITVRFAYTADGKLASLTAVNADTGDQVTTYQYGTTLTDSALARSDLLRSVIYPDAVDLSDRVTYRYNRQQQTIGQTDQNGTVREFDYDKLGRLTADRVVTLGDGVNGAVRRLETAYNSRGLAAAITSLNAVSGGSIVNQIVRTYNNFQQLAVEYQSHSAAVNTASTPAVTYAYADGSANTVRPTSVTYPKGRVVTTSYGAAGSDDDRLSRTGSYVDPGSVTLAAYTYLGLGSVVKVDYPTPQVRYDLATGSGSNPYAGLDRFGRVIDSLWQAYGTSPGAREQVRYGYDRASNRIWRKNQVAPSGKNDELYGYDGVQRLVESARGSFSGDERSHINDLQFAQDWTLDATGNWNRMVQTDTVEPAKNLDQSRWQNQANEITAITRRYGIEWPTPTYDRNGNMLHVMSGNTNMVYWDTQYDAWNRMVHIGSVDYEYDGLNRRVRTSWSANDRHYYFNADWQLLETRQGSSTLAERQFVWGVRYIDDLILRDRFTSGGALQDRLFALQDANWNVTAIVDTTGAVAERYRYTAYGAVTFLNAAFEPVSVTDSVKDWETLYAGYYWAWEGGWYQVRNRWYHSLLGQWITRDPIEYLSASPSLYNYTQSSPLGKTDWRGLVTDEVLGAGADPSGGLQNNASSQFCIALLAKIMNIRYEIAKRIGELDEDPLGLPERCPGDKLKPSLSRRGHRDLITKLKAQLAIHEAMYAVKCTRGPITGPIPVPVPVPVPIPVPVTVPDPIPTPVVVVGSAAAAAGCGYLIYRGCRLIPSLIPPLWPTIPANLAIP